MTITNLTSQGLTRAAASRAGSPALVRAALVLLALYLAGAAWAVADGLASAPDALLNGSEVDAPLPIIAAQVGGALLASRLRGRAGVAGAALVVLACTVSLAAFASDGDLGQAGLSGSQVAYQLVIGAVTAATGLLAARRIAQAARARRTGSPSAIRSA